MTEEDEGNRFCLPEGFYIDVVTWEVKETWKQKGAAFKVCSLPTSMEWGIPAIASGGGQTKKLWTLESLYWKRFRFKGLFSMAVAQKGKA